MVVGEFDVDRENGVCGVAFVGISTPHPLLIQEGWPSPASRLATAGVVGHTVTFVTLDHPGSLRSPPLLYQEGIGIPVLIEHFRRRVRPRHSHPMPAVLQRYTDGTIL